MVLISILAAPDAPLYCVQSDDIAAYTRSTVRGARGSRSSPSTDKSPTPAESPEAAVQDCQQDVVMVSGKEGENGEKREGDNDDEVEGTEDQQQQEGEGERDEDECVYASEDEDEGTQQGGSSDSDVGELEEENVVNTDLQVAVALEAISDSELLTDPSLTELEGNAPEVRV